MNSRTGVRQWALAVLLGAVWLGIVGTGLGLLAAYDYGPGTPASATARWPAGSRLDPASDGPTLVMLAHPRCTCTRASLGELAELMARARHRPRAYVLFLRPGGVSDGWEQTDLWEAAVRIPGVTAVRDDAGEEAARFGAETSGQTFLYDAGGRLRFSGGTTGARGHPGDNAGRATLLAMLNDEAVHRNGTPVFGCPLFGPHDGRPASRGASHGAHNHVD